MCVCVRACIEREREEGGSKGSGKSSAAVAEKLEWKTICLEGSEGMTLPDDSGVTGKIKGRGELFPKVPA